MREILFRAWNPHKKEMIYQESEKKEVFFSCLPVNTVCHEEVSPYKFIFQGDLASLEYEFGDIDDENYSCGFLGFGNGCDNALEQFTGYADIQETKVFEGDIIQVGDFNWIVVFKSGAFRCEKVENRKKVKNIGYLAVYGITVIGNIHENLELLSCLP